MRSPVCVIILLGSITLSPCAELARPKPPGKTVTISGPRDIDRVVKGLKPGMIVKIGAGDYSGDHEVRGIADLTIEAADAKRPPHFIGGGNAWHFVACPGLTLRNLRVSGQTSNGLNIDDGGNAGGAKGITLEHIEVSDIGPKGNFDGLKCSGVDELTIRDCTIAGWGGQGIDCVGCHHVVVTGCQFTGKEGFTATAGVQFKGGSSDVLVEKCHFKNAGERPFNIGGSTGLEFFRPQGTKYEAARIVARANLIEGSLCAAAFVGVDGAEFSGNTILFPTKWIFRVLQETKEPGFVPCRNVLVKDNRIVFRRAQVQVEVNIGTGTAPETFQFEKNRWFAEDQPSSSKPKLPVAEKDGTYDSDPR